MDTIEEFQPPHDAEAEQALLGSVLIDPDTLYEVSEIVTADMFYQPRNRWLFEAITAINARSEPVDLLTISSELRRADRLDETGGTDYLLDLINCVPTSINADAYAAIVAEKATRRRLILAAGQVAKLAYNETIPVLDAVAAAESAVFAVNQSTGRGTVVSARRNMSDYIDRFMNDVAATDSPNFMTTGLIDLDRALGGMEKPHQYFIAGRTSMGKSSLALQIALHAAMRQGKRVMIFSLEMSEDQIDNRFISLMTRIPVERLRAARRRELSQAEQSAVMEASGRIADSAIYMDCSGGLRPMDIRGRAARVYAAHGLDMIVVDHMHIMTANNPTGKQVQDLGAIAIDLATIYKEFNVAGVTLAQLNRGVDARAIKRPMLSDLRESGQIEEAAYCVMFVHRDAYYDETAPVTQAEIIIPKNRDGATGSVTVGWKPELATFVNTQQVQL